VIRTYHFAILLDASGVYRTTIQGTYFERPYQILCSDANKGSAIVVHWDPMTGRAAPPCNP
jgi:hypothetical protein